MADIEKRTVQIDLEVDTKTVDSSKNPYQGWIHMARAVDSWRIFPRLLITLYGFAFYRTTEWFMTLPDPTNAQSAFVSVIVGAGAAWFGLYVGSGKK